MEKQKNMNSKKLKELLKKEDKTEALKVLNPVIQFLSDMINSGVLLKNVKRHLENKGITGKACNNLIELAKLRAEKFRHYAIK